MFLEAGSLMLSVVLWADSVGIMAIWQERLPAVHTMEMLIWLQLVQEP